MQKDSQRRSASVGSTYQLPQRRGVGKWAFLAIIAAILLHVLAYIAFKNIHILLPAVEKRKEVQTKVVRTKEIEVAEPGPEKEWKASDSGEMEPEPVAIDEIEVLAELPEMDLDILPDVKELQVPLEAVAPAAEGELLAEAIEFVEAPGISMDIPDLGKTEDYFDRVAEGQIAVDPGGRLADSFDPDELLEEMKRKGADGSAADGVLQGFTTLDDMARMSGSQLLSAKALIGSDLLFDFNKDQLRQSARVSLMKVAFLIDRHPNMFCIIDGHTDLVGGESFNLALSERRAEAVKSWLVESVQADPERIIVRAFGKSKPIVLEGDQDAQAPNRRVEIRMRTELADLEEDKAQELPEAQADEPENKAILVRPAPPENVAVVVEDPTPRATVVEEDADVAPAAVEVIEVEPPRRAVPVEEDIPGRALIVE
ncbi:OmpA family protein [Persicirhabdus sediminis]|uniref:OmpA family protein n=1 Tax=Persicirhabdus sediminis TaxID=454144 RepID=A0A8J7ME27_9BACT|nr:OmpA family protein [Persicirhabdus sediminis]MBK1791011.1 OmpA family protein [Persicirhabdus sediminis]